ncbi:MAG: response regulator transcription factor [Betaproteobacteria bacterium]|nr:response regulator transcription factor [Betaproteobacteria bacterium]MBI2959354.1 response regulator transcription factor [Betaproteobacteria bacterium]
MSDAGKHEIHVLEDDPLVARTVMRTLEEHGLSCRWFRTAAELLACVDRHPPALCIVDLGLPDRDGLEVVRELRQRSDCGVMILTARGFLSDRVIGLEFGADDYVVKPFEPRELVARVRSILRRYGGLGANAAQGGRRVACFEGWQFDTASFALTDPEGGAEVLGAAEAHLLQTLLEHPNRIQTRQQLAGTPDLLPYDRSIDVRISRLRRKLRDDPHNPRLVKTVYGVGYLLAVNVSWTGRAEHG